MPNTAAERLPIPVQMIERRIYLIRAQKVMLDSDLAEQPPCVLAATNTKSLYAASASAASSRGSVPTRTLGGTLTRRVGRGAKGATPDRPSIE